MLFKSTYHPFGGVRFVISLYMIFIFRIKSFSCADEIASQESPSISHNSFASHTKHNLRRNNRLTVLPQNIDPSTFFKLLTVVVGVIAISLMVVRCMRSMKCEKSIQKPLPKSKLDKDGVPEYEGGTGSDMAGEQILPDTDLNLPSGEENLPSGEENLPSGEEAYPGANEIRVASANGFYGAVALCQYLGLKDASDLSYLDALVKEETRKWQEPVILIATSVANNDEFEGNFTPAEIELLQGRRFKDLQQLKEILNVGDPTPLKTASNLVNLAKDFMEEKHHISLPELSSVLKSLQGRQMCNIQDLDYLKPLKDVLPGGIDDPRNTIEKTFTERVEGVIQHLIRLNNMLVAFQDHVKLSMMKFSTSDQDLLRMIRTEGDTAL